jgi:hypothetical protein
MLTKKYYKVEEYVADLEPWMQEQFYVVREIILHTHPDIQEAIRYQVPFYTLKGMLFYVALYKKKHFILGFCDGAKLSDPNAMLLADAKQKYIRHWRLQKEQEPDYELLAQYIEEAVAIKLK